MGSKIQCLATLPSSVSKSEFSIQVPLEFPNDIHCADSYFKRKTSTSVKDIYPESKNKSVCVCHHRQTVSHSRRFLPYNIPLTIYKQEDASASSSSRQSQSAYPRTTHRISDLHVKHDQHLHLYLIGHPTRLKQRAIYHAVPSPPNMQSVYHHRFPS